MSVKTANCSPRLTRPIATPATGASIGTPASNSASESATVAIEEEPFDSRMSRRERVREVLVVRQHRQQRAAGQHAVADLAAARRAHELDLADAERREVVVEKELLGGLALVLLDDLGISLGAEGDRGEPLGLAAGEERGAVGARQQAHLDRDRTDSSSARRRSVDR
jgi:hypothetical protein